MATVLQFPTMQAKSDNRLDARVRRLAEIFAGARSVKTGEQLGESEGLRMARQLIARIEEVRAGQS